MKFLVLLITIILTCNNLLSLPPVVMKYSSYSVSDDGAVIAYYGEKNRVEIKYLNQVSTHVTDCLISTEDRDFYNHNGVSWKGIGRAIISTIGGKKQGGSTLTMQLARNLFLSHEQTISRKLNEIEIAKELEANFTKDQILLLYLNTVYFANGCYGIWTASQEYFSKTPDKLSISEAATIIGLLKNPNGYNPLKFPEKALKRRNEVMHNLVETGKLKESDYNKLTKLNLQLKPRQRFSPAFAEFIKIKADSILKYQSRQCFDGGLKIFTTLNSKVQSSVEKAVNEQFKVYPKHLKQVQLGLISLEPGTGKIRAMLGESPFSEKSGLNRSYQITRQVGSAFKPIMYGSLLADGFTLGTPLKDKPLVLNAGKPYEWKPENYDKSYTNEMVDMRRAMAYSLNLPAANAIVDLTNPEKVALFAEKLGFKMQTPFFPSLALGAYETNPWRMAAAFSAFASSGRYVEPFGIEKIEDNNWNSLYEHKFTFFQVIDAETAYLITDALKMVVDSGTAKLVRKFYKGVAAGKTGTTSDNKDAWFIGYCPELTTAIWLGFDRFRDFGGKGFNGGTLAAPLWGRIMGSLGKMLKKDFVQPINISFKELCEQNGYPPDNSDCKLWQTLFPVDTIKLQLYRPYSPK